MRFLKNKILKAQEALKKRLIASPGSSSHVNTNEIDLLKTEEFAQSPPRVETNPEKPLERVEKKPRMYQELVRKEDPTDASLKNIAVNYARAIASFAISSLAVPYLKTRLENEIVTLEEFVAFIDKEKNKMGGICSFRARLLVEDTDDAKVATCKRVFQWIAEVFIKYFSVNWIINGRVSHKETYLKFRYKMLRRVQNPESFTYIRDKKASK